MSTKEKSNNNKNKETQNEPVTNAKDEKVTMEEQTSKQQQDQSTNQHNQTINQQDQVINLELDKLKIDSGTQGRSGINHRYVEELCDTMYDGGKEFQLPPVIVFYDGEFYHLADGFHRRMVYLRVGRKTIPAIVKQGTVRDAIIYGVGCNAAHGLRRTVTDIERCLYRLLDDKEWRNRSVRWLADTVKCSFHLAKKTKTAWDQERKSQGKQGIGDSKTVTAKDGRELPAHTEQPTTTDEAPPEAGDAWEAPDNEEVARLNKEATRDLLALRDAVNQPIPNHLKDIFVDDFLKHSIAHVNALLVQVKNNQKTYPYLHKKEFFDALETVVIMLHGGVPWVICPFCKGDGCNKCHSHGFLSRAIYEEAEILDIQENKHE
jgi:hypothetical protein